MTYLWGGFTLTYVGRIGRDLGFTPLAVLCIALLGFRLLGKVRVRQLNRVS